MQNFFETNEILWERGQVADPKTGKFYRYQAKVYDKGSEYGINGGRISKLNIRALDSNIDLCSYERGWDTRPTDEVSTVYEILLAKYN